MAAAIIAAGVVYRRGKRQYAAPQGHRKKYLAQHSVVQVRGFLEQ